MDASYTAPPEFTRYRMPALIVGILFLVVCVGASAISAPGIGQFFRSYLLGFIFWIGIALGCLALLMLQHLTGGAWGMVIRRVLEAATRTLPLMLILFIPLLFGMHYLYEWTHHEAVANNEILRDKSGYLNVPFFLVRAAVYFGIWILLMFLLNKWSAEQDRTAERRLIPRMRTLSGPGIVLFVLTVTFASVDWVMSLDPEWFSTIFGLLFVAAWTLSAFSFVIAVMAMLSGRAPLEDVVQPRHFHDLGKLLLAFVMLWAYFAFSQWLIIWSGNIPEETKWYLHRIKGGWGVVGMALIIMHFAFPFLLLLSSTLKRNPRLLSRVALLVFFMRLVDLFWVIVPEFHRGNIGMSIFEWVSFIAAPIGIGGLWLAFFSWQLRQRPLLPINDPYLEQSIAHEHGGH